MPGLGTLVNSAAIIGGGLLGVVGKKWIKDRFRSILNVALGLSIIAMSVSGFVAEMLTVKEGGGFGTRGTYMVVLSLVIGGFLGELIDLDGKMELFGDFLKKKTGNAKDAAFTEAFVSASLTVCIGAMAVMGSIMDGIAVDHKILFTKAILDFVIIMVMTAAKGKGCIFSFIPVVLFQGTLTALSFLLKPLLNDLAMSNLSMVGSILVLCIGVNLIGDGKFRIKVANLLPAVVLAVAAAYIPFLD